VAHLLEYLARFVARLRPLSKEDGERLVARFVASFTHQSVEIDGQEHPAGRRFPRLRIGTADSTRRFMIRLIEVALQQEAAAQMGATGVPTSVAERLTHFTRTQSGVSSLEASSASVAGSSPILISSAGSNGAGLAFKASPSVALQQGGVRRSVEAMVHQDGGGPGDSAISGRRIIKAGRRLKAAPPIEEPAAGSSEAREDASESRDRGDLEELERLEADLPE